MRTVQGELERALATLMHTSEEEVRLTVAGRTDAGVHARRQVAHIDLDPVGFARWAGSDEGRLAHRLSGVLRRFATDVAVLRVESVPREFDARFSALRRSYEYRIRDLSYLPDPLTERYTVHVRAKLDVSLMQESANDLIGLRDFSAFCRAREGSTGIRTLERFDWVRG